MLFDIPLYMYRGQPRMARPAQLYDYVLAEQGLIKRVENRYVSADYLLVPIEENLIGLQLSPYPLRPLDFKLPRMPGRLLQAVLDDARSNLELEFVYHFHFDRHHWSVERAGHKSRSKTYINYVSQNPHNVVLELHSHNTMPAFFSKTDDADEQGGRFYAVIGHLEQANPEIVLRLGLYGHWWPNVPAGTLFDELGSFVDTYTEGQAGDSYFGQQTQPAEEGWFSNLFKRR